MHAMHKPLNPKVGEEGKQKWISIKGRITWNMQKIKNKYAFGKIPGHPNVKGCP